MNFHPLPVYTKTQIAVKMPLKISGAMRGSVHFFHSRLDGTVIFPGRIFPGRSTDLLPPLISSFGGCFCILNVCKKRGSSTAQEAHMLWDLLLCFLPKTSLYPPGAFLDSFCCTPPYLMTGLV